MKKIANSAPRQQIYLGNSRRPHADNPITDLYQLRMVGIHSTALHSQSTGVSMIKTALKTIKKNMVLDGRALWGCIHHTVKGIRALSL